MSDGTIRINKVLKDFNIGSSTLQEFFKKKNIDIEVKPTNKITEDVYELVAKEFSKEQILKEQASKVAIKVKEITEMGSHHGEPQEPVKEIVIKTNVLTGKAAKAAEPEKPAAEAKPAKAEKPKEEPAKEEPKAEPVKAEKP
ncbi:MAG: hypothetical protein IKR30_04860, partial [Bacteroidales bacterium]|nr:hypothetical protein [Bacteroidales bacterium]